MDHRQIICFPFEKSKLKLGAGGSGHVFLGRSVIDREHLVAIKCKYVKSGRSAADTYHPDDEAEHCIMERCCNHPNTMSLLAAVTVGDQTHFAMDLMSTDFGNELKRGLRMTLRQTAFVLRELLQAVAHIHSLGLVHRDIKPSNILAKFDSGCAAGVRVVLGDFGVAHYVTEAPRSSLNYRGTPVFNAPEVLLSRVAIEDAAAIDMWATGCCMFQFVTGAQLLTGTTSLSVLMNACDIFGTEVGAWPLQTRPSKLRSMLPPIGVPPSALDLLERLLHINPKMRISAADALLHPFFAEFGTAIDAPIAIIGYERFDASKFSFSSIVAETSAPPTDENVAFFAHHTSHNSSGSSSIHLSQQRTANRSGTQAHHHLTLSNLRTNALFNSSGVSQQRFASSQRVLFGSPQHSTARRGPDDPHNTQGHPLPSNSVTASHHLFDHAALGCRSTVSPSPARRTLMFDSPMRGVDLNDAAIHE